MSRKVLLIEDEPNITEAIRFLLTREGWLVETHAEGTDAVQVIAASKPDLVILDVMLPGKSGMDILEELRGIDKFENLPVLVLTAKGQAKDRKAAVDAGSSLFMSKPFANHEIVTNVNKLLSA